MKIANMPRQNPDPLVPPPSSPVPDQDGAPPPWYRQFWPWFLMALPASAVVAGIVTIVIAVNNPDDLVDDDYYKSGLAITRMLERERRAASLHIHASVAWAPATGQIVLQLGSDAPPENRLILTLLHPTVAERDLAIPLLHQGQGRYTGLLDQPPIAGNWHLILTPEDKSWRLASRARLPAETRWQLAP
ncbi:MAG TPA: hypothetical protein EYP40_02490 [Chromatiales bacterium]|nr:hypothetical protein [Chromatiales bacterium]